MAWRLGSLLGRHGGDYGIKDIQVLHYGIWPWRRILNGACISISNLLENIAWQTHRSEARGPLKSGAWGGRPTCHPQTPPLLLPNGPYSVSTFSFYLNTQKQPALKQRIFLVTRQTDGDQCPCNIQQSHEVNVRDFKQAYHNICSYSNDACGEKINFTVKTNFSTSEMCERIQTNCSFNWLGHNFWEKKKKRASDAFETCAE